MQTNTNKERAGAHGHIHYAVQIANKVLTFSALALSKQCSTGERRYGISSEKHFSALNNIMHANTWISDANQMENTTKILTHSLSLDLFGCQRIMANESFQWMLPERIMLNCFHVFRRRSTETGKNKQNVQERVRVAETERVCVRERCKSHANVKWKNRSKFCQVWSCIYK